MDANGTRFHLVLTADEWLGPAGPGTSGNGGGSGNGAVSAGPIEWQDGALRLRALVPLFPTPPGAAALDPLARRGADRDRYGNWYWVASAGDEVRTLPAGWSASERFWPAPRSAPVATPTFAPAAPHPGGPLSAAGVAVTTDHCLLVGALDPPGLLVFDLYGGGAPLELRWPAGVAFAPADIAATPDGGAWVLDRGHAALWRLDRELRVVPPTTASPQPRRSLPSRRRRRARPGRDRCRLAPGRARSPPPAPAG